MVPVKIINLIYDLIDDNTVIRIYRPNSLFPVVKGKWFEDGILRYLNSFVDKYECDKEGNEIKIVVT